MTYENCYLTAELDGTNVENLRLAKTHVRPMMSSKIRVCDNMPWPAVGGGSGQVTNAAVEESKEPEPGRPNQAAATAA